MILRFTPTDGVNVARSYSAGSMPLFAVCGLWFRVAGLPLRRVCGCLCSACYFDASMKRSQNAVLVKTRAAGIVVTIPLLDKSLQVPERSEDPRKILFALRAGSRLILSDKEKYCSGFPQIAQRFAAVPLHYAEGGRVSLGRPCGASRRPAPIYTQANFDGCR